MSERHFSAERTELAKMYPGNGWIKKVMNMSDEQVHAAYISIRSRKEKKKNRVRECSKSAS